MTHTSDGEGIARFENTGSDSSQSHPSQLSPSQESSNSVEVITRFHYMDNLRALAMLVGIFFHAALAYSPLMQNLWLSADAQNSVMFDLISWFLHLFRMPVFFLISGFFALMLIEKRGISGFLKNRGLRIALPFVIFLPLVLASIIGVIVWAMANVESQSPMLQLIASTAGNPDVPQPPFSTTHLWFLFNLGLFCLMAAALHKFNFFHSKLMQKATSAKMLVFVLPLLLVPALYSQTAPNPAPERIYPELWSFGYFGIIFVVGGFIFGRQALLDELASYKYWMLFFSLAGYALLYQLLPKQITLMDVIATQQGIAHSWQHLLVALLEAYIGVYMMFVSLIISKKLLNNHSRVFRFIADSSYWVYIIHLPLLFYIQYLLLDVSWNIWIKFLVGSFATIAIGMVTYLLLVRWTPIGWLLNGRKKRS